MNRKEQLKILNDILLVVDDKQKEEIKNIFYKYFLNNDNFTWMEIEYMNKKNLSKREFSNIHDIQKNINYSEICEEIGFEE